MVMAAVKPETLAHVRPVFELSERCTDDEEIVV